MEPIDSEPFRLGYRRWLDGLRGVAILLVLAYHFGFISGGWIGVDIFFVLSGFLITTVLAEEWRDRGSFSLPRFYLRRALRLFPAFAVLLTMCAAAIPFLSGPTERTEALQKLAVAACYVANWPMLHNVNLTWIGHSWSLSVEEQFYLLWPVSAARDASGRHVATGHRGRRDRGDCALRDRSPDSLSGTEGERPRAPAGPFAHFSHVHGTRHPGRCCCSLAALRACLPSGVACPGTSISACERRRAPRWPPSSGFPGPHASNIRSTTGGSSRSWPFWRRR